jgi:hypothetical protein
VITLWLLALGCGTAADFQADLALREGTVHVALPPGADLPQGTVDNDLGRAWLEVHVAGGETGQPVIGTYERTGDTLIFAPRFQVRPDTTWQVSWHPPDGHAQTFTLRATPPGPVGEPPRLLRIEPGAAIVPENLLKLTLTFSKPMRGGLTLTDHVHLSDRETGAIDPRAWYRTELWGPERDRLTMLFHPGRIKTGVSFNTEFGPVLEAGHSYRVTVTTGLVDLDGEPLVEPGIWEFEAVAADHTRPVPEDWVLTAPTSPEAGLSLAFDEPMDGWLRETAFAVEDVVGTVPGTLAPRDDCTAITFTPRDPWGPGDYVLRQVGQVEDRAGNKPDRIFDGPAGEVARAGPIQDTWRFTVEVP